MQSELEITLLQLGVGLGVDFLGAKIAEMCFARETPRTR